MATNRTQNETLLALQRKQELDKELQKLGRQEIVSKESRAKALNDLLTDKNIRQQKDFEQAGKNQFGVSAGYIAKEKDTGNTFILKQFYKSNIDAITKQDRDNRRDINKDTHIQQQQNKSPTPAVQTQNLPLPEVNKPQVIRINPDMLHNPEIKQAMLGFRNLVNKPLPIELKNQKKGVAHKIKKQLSNIKHKVKKVLGR